MVQENTMRDGGSIKTKTPFTSIAARPASVRVRISGPRQQPGPGRNAEKRTGRKSVRGSCRANSSRPEADRRNAVQVIIEE